MFRISTAAQELGRLIPNGVSMLYIDKNTREYERAKVADRDKERENGRACDGEGTLLVLHEAVDEGNLLFDRAPVRVIVAFDLRVIV